MAQWEFVTLLGQLDELMKDQETQTSIVEINESEAIAELQRVIEDTIFIPGSTYTTT